MAELKKRKSNAGRPKIEVDRDEVEKLCHMQCTAIEIAGFFDMSVDTLDLRCKEWGFNNFTDFFKRYSQGGKISLRRSQFSVAEKGNVTMLIWLGKQYLGQKERFDLFEDERYEEPETMQEEG